jgi:hypothetical protein
MEKTTNLLQVTDKDLVRINPTKTDLVPLTRKATNFELNMGANSIEQTNETKLQNTWDHIGFPDLV